MKETRDQLKLQLDQYMEQQAESKQAFHKWMKCLEVASLGIILVVFCVALYFSITWKSVNPIIIPLAWFAFAASGSLLIALNGVHTTILRGFPASILPSKAQKFVIGRKAVWIGLTLILGGLAYAGFWGMVAYATWTANYELLRPLISFLGIVLGLGIAASILIKMISTTLQKLQ
jgi:hypothetical protein